MSKYYKLLVFTFIASLSLFGCNSPKDDTILPAKDFPEVTQDYKDFTTVSAYRLLNDSKTIAIPDDLKFLPDGLNEDGLLFGIATTDDKNVHLAYLDTNTEEYTLLKKAKSKDTSIKVLTAASDYVIFQEYKNAVARYYYYNLDNRNLQLIKETKNASPVHFDEGVNDENTVYLSLENNTNIEQVSYDLYSYNHKTNKLTVIEDTNSSTSPVMYKGNLYYLYNDNDEHRMFVKKYDPKEKTTTSIIQCDEEYGKLTKLQTDGNTLYLLLEKESMTNCYKFDPNTQKITPYFYIDYLEQFKGSTNYLTWTGTRSVNRLRPQYYLLNTSKDTLYNYEHSSLNFNTNSIVWTEFLVEEDTIPKGEIFTTDYSQFRVKKLS